MSRNSENKKNKKAFQYRPFKEQVGFVRDRGQITIPKKMRKDNPWLSEDTPIKIIYKPNKIIIKPYEPSNKK